MSIKDLIVEIVISHLAIDKNAMDELRNNRVYVNNANFWDKLIKQYIVVVPSQVSHNRNSLECSAFRLLRIDNRQMYRRIRRVPNVAPSSPSRSPVSHSLQISLLQPPFFSMSAPQLKVGQRITSPAAIISLNIMCNVFVLMCLTVYTFCMYPRNIMSKFTLYWELSILELKLVSWGYSGYCTDKITIKFWLNAICFW